MRKASFIMSLLLLAFAGLQLNDPDPFLWTAIYLLPAALSFETARGRLGWLACWAWAAVYCGLTGWWWNNGQSGESCGEIFGKIPWPDFFASEATRETAGLSIVALWLAILTVNLVKNKSIRGTIEK